MSDSDKIILFEVGKVGMELLASFGRFALETWGQREEIEVMTIPERLRVIANMRAQYVGDMEELDEVLKA